MQVLSWNRNRFKRESCEDVELIEGGDSLYW